MNKKDRHSQKRNRNYVKKEPNKNLELNYIISKITHLLSGLNSRMEINRKNGNDRKRFH